MNYYDNGNPKASRITSIDILNSHDLSLLLTASGIFLTLIYFYRVSHKNMGYLASQKTWDISKPFLVTMVNIQQLASNQDFSFLGANRNIF